MSIKEIYKTDVFSFGKYKGQKIDDICKQDPCYVTWCIYNVDGFNAQLGKEMCEAIEADCQENQNWHEGDLPDDWGDKS